MITHFSTAQTQTGNPPAEGSNSDKGGTSILTYVLWGVGFLAAAYVVNKYIIQPRIKESEE